MTISLSEKENELFLLLSDAGVALNITAYVIGGFVRDKVLNRTSKDIDIVCLGDGIHFAQQVSKKLLSNPEVHFFKNFGTAQIKTDGFILEFVGARKESYQKDSRKPKVAPGTLEDDQNRRDFTINALAFSLSKEDFGKVIDPFDGLMDIKDKIIRTPLAPEQTFSDDPLRMLRAIRFAAQLQFNIDTYCLAGISAQKERIKIVSKERISDELNKIMICKKPSVGFLLLHKTGLLSILLPQLEALSGVEYIDNKGHKDNFYHSLQVVDNISKHTDNLWLRWAALLHDIGKAKAKKYEKGRGWTFHGHEIISAKMVVPIFKNLRLPTGEKMAYVRKIISLHHRPISLTKENITDAALRRLLFDAGDELEDLLTLCKADITSKNKEKKKRFQTNFDMVLERLKTVEEKDRIRNWQPPVGGNEIMTTFHLTPSREVGTIKTAIREAILDGIIPNDYDAAYDFMLKKAAEMGIFPADKA